MLIVRVSDSCTTGWAHWGHGELWLSPDALVRVGKSSITWGAIKRGATSGLAGGALGSTMREIHRARSQGLVVEDVDGPAWVRQVRGEDHVLYVPLEAIAGADVVAGITTSRLKLATRDGQEFKLLWMRNDLVLPWVERAVHDPAAHRAALQPDDAPVRDDAAPVSAPAPFTVEQLVGGCPVGRTLRYRVEVVGEPPRLRTERVVAVDELGASFEVTETTPDHAVVAGPTSERRTWDEVQHAAALLPSRTTTQDDYLESPLGEIETVRYTVKDGTTHTLHWFAPSRPGPPLQTLVRHEGRLRTKVEVVEDDLPPS